MTSVLTLCGIIKHCLNEYIEGGSMVRSSMAEGWIFVTVEEAGYFDGFYQTRCQHDGRQSSIDEVDLLEPSPRFRQAVSHGFDAADGYFPSGNATSADVRYNVAQALYSVLIDGEYIEADMDTEVVR